MIVGGYLSIMARWLTVLVALVAQGMALLSPVCFVRCVGADGHECVELVGQGCRCCDCRSHEGSQVVCAVANCDEQCQHEDDEQEAPVGPQIAAECCTCEHSPLDSAPQVQVKSLASDGLMTALDFVTTLDFVTVVRGLENLGFQRSLLRPHESPQLAALTTVVLRV